MSDGQSHAIETMQVEERRFPPSPEFTKQANAQPDIYDKGFDEFWTEAAGRVSWLEPWKQLYEWKAPYSTRYIGGKRNVCYDCVDRHGDRGNGVKGSVFWDGEPEDEPGAMTLHHLQRG